MDTILREKTASILLIEERQRTDIIIGAPHHTFGGVKNMPCPEHKDGDENTGFIARQIADKLNVSSIIACNYRIDPNKGLTTDYSSQIIKWNPQYLIEIHGHGARMIDDYSLEISSGVLERNTFSKHFATTLKDRFQGYDILKKYKVCGDFSHIHFKAVKTLTIVDERWIPIHIEFPPSLRLDEKNKLPLVFNDLCTCLIETVTEVCKGS